MWRGRRHCCRQGSGDRPRAGSPRRSEACVPSVYAGHCSARGPGSSAFGCALNNRTRGLRNAAATRAGFERLSSLSRPAQGTAASPGQWRARSRRSRWHEAVAPARETTDPQAGAGPAPGRWQWPHRANADAARSSAVAGLGMPAQRCCFPRTARRNQQARLRRFRWQACDKAARVTCQHRDNADNDSRSEPVRK